MATLESPISSPTGGGGASGPSYASTPVTASTPVGINSQPTTDNDPLDPIPEGPESPLLDSTKEKLLPNIEKKINASQNGLSDSVTLQAGPASTCEQTNPPNPDTIRARLQYLNVKPRPADLPLKGRTERAVSSPGIMTPSRNLDGSIEMDVVATKLGPLLAKQPAGSASRRRESSSVLPEFQGSTTSRPDSATALEYSNPSMPGRTSSPRKTRRSSGLQPVRASLAPPPSAPQLPLPPVSLPSYLHLELTTSPISSRYIYRLPPSDSESIRESTRVKISRLTNFLLLPPHLESALLFGALACLDAWLYNFTILPIRFLAAVAVLGRWLAANAWKETVDFFRFISGACLRLIELFKYSTRFRSKEDLAEESATADSDAVENKQLEQSENTASEPVPKTPTVPMLKPRRRRHQRTLSTPSLLQPNHKSDLLRGLIIIGTCAILMSFDASRMYHAIRGQSAIKLYVIFNVLEVADKLLSAIGQDIMECLLSSEVLERGSDGRSRVWRPTWMFLLAMVYSSTHAIALFYQAITLNVAVNSYSNALLTLLMSNQFVEIKGTVFKRFDKEGLFQMTCADIIERFQLWLMMTIIAMRNIVELSPFFSSSMSFRPIPGTISDRPNVTTPPSSMASITPASFTLLPEWAGQVITPMLVVLGSEMIVDWLKHAYITKFSNTRRDVYGRYLDILTRDYYSNAFSGNATSSGRDITRRLGLPVIPLSCLFIRSAAQTYKMFISAHVYPTFPSPASSIGRGANGPTTTAAISHIDFVLRRALSRSGFGGGNGWGIGAQTAPTTEGPVTISIVWNVLIQGDWKQATSIFGRLFSSLKVWELADDAIALTTLILVILACWLLLLATKLVLGMGLLRFSQMRYQKMLYRQKMLEREAERGRTREKKVADPTASQTIRMSRPQRPPQLSTEHLQPHLSNPVDLDSSVSITPTRLHKVGSYQNLQIPPQAVPASAPQVPIGTLDPPPKTAPPSLPTTAPSSSAAVSESASAAKAAVTPPTSSSATGVELPPSSLVRRSGPFGTVQISESARAHIYESDPAGLRSAQRRVEYDAVEGAVGLAKPLYEPEAPAARNRDAAAGTIGKLAAKKDMELVDKLSAVERYKMTGKRIW